MMLYVRLLSVLMITLSTHHVRNHLTCHNKLRCYELQFHLKNQNCWKIFLFFFSYIYIYFFSIWVFFHEHSRFTEQQGKGEGIYLTPLYHFHLLHRHLDISRAITAGSPLHIAGSRTRTGNLWFPSASR